jgi:3-deoxy-D-arabino-heptulosonate 7-phosphate (DAHP) synthase class II
MTDELISTLERSTDRISLFTISRRWMFWISGERTRQMSSLDVPKKEQFEAPVTAKCSRTCTIRYIPISK